MMVEAELVHGDDVACRPSGSMRVKANTNHHEGVAYVAATAEHLKAAVACVTAAADT